MPSETNPSPDAANSEPQVTESANASGSPTQQARKSITTLTSLFEDPQPSRVQDDSVEEARSTSIQGAEAPPASQSKIDDPSLEAALLTRKTDRSGASNPQLEQALEAASAQKSVKPIPSKKQESLGPANSDLAAKAAVSPNSASTSSAPTSVSTQSSSDSADQVSKSGGSEAAEKPSTLSPDQQVRIKREEDYLSLIFPREQAAANPDITVDFVDSELWQQLQQRLSGGERFWKSDTSVHLNAQNHLLDARQLQELGEALDRFDLKLTRIATSRRQTAVAAATAGFSVAQGAELPQLLPFSSETPDSKNSLTAEPLYLQTTVRSGAEIRHPGSVIIMGDLNPGSSVVADGDILIWGRLRGIAHAGAAGNQGSIILAMKLEPTQLRIANAVALVPESAQGPMLPEVAYVTAKGDIRITEAAGFIRPRR